MNPESITFRILRGGRLEDVDGETWVETMMATLDAEQRAKLIEHVAYMEAAVYRSQTADPPKWSYALGGAMLLAAWTMLADRSSTLRDFGQYAITITAALACVPPLMHGPPSPLPPNVTDPDTIATLKRLRRTSWGMYLGTWAIVGLQIGLIGTRIWLSIK